MMKRATSAALTFACLVGSGSPGHADQKVSLGEISAKARETIGRQVGDGQIDEIEREQKRNQIVYEVEFTTASGLKYEIDVAEDGTLLGKEQE